MAVASFETKNTKIFFELLDIDTRFFDEERQIRKIVLPIKLV